MAKSANTQNIAVYVDVDKRLGEIADEMKVSKLEIASQLLRQAFDSGDIKIEMKTIKYTPKSAPKGRGK